ncbi:MAG: hypothetical protein FWH06_07965 [Oscillospiraceae bacterium]|nr:hypothetical protein [Oscillospiraceae bacterium]
MTVHTEENVNPQSGGAHPPDGCPACGQLSERLAAAELRAQELLTAAAEAAEETRLPVFAMAAGGPSRAAPSRRDRINDALRALARS